MHTETHHIAVGLSEAAANDEHQYTHEPIELLDGGLADTLIYRE